MSEAKKTESTKKTTKKSTKKATKKATKPTDKKAATKSTKKKAAKKTTVKAAAKPAAKRVRKVTAKAKTGGKLRIKQVRSGIGHTGKMRRTLRALGLRHHQAEVVLADNPSVRGMVHQVHHLVRVTEEA